jgi:hypothetical protein
MQEFTDAAGETGTRFAQHTSKAADLDYSIMKDIGIPRAMKAFS